ncbi:TenA family protein [Vacuolonema iberomarrocanum]|uniref:TenA family protein n=1 Tax=Vacuolonema iberomarrocanum TaxID=3454632 RepID=UPI0019E40399|nr:TenA family protein [filamentous cyanobacterium LEGE 07170]
MADSRLNIPPFAQSCLQVTGNVWFAAQTHPFVQALADGSLPVENFRFYQMQDARYLEAFTDACSIISARCVQPDDKLWFIDAAKLALVVERQLHTEYGKQLGYDATDIAQLTLTPNNLAYQNHMLVTCHRGALLEAIAVLTPCPWLYTELGQRLQTQLGSPSDDHPYVNWLRTYADDGFVAYTNTLLAYLEAAAQESGEQTRQRAQQAFLTSVRYEWMFWQQAWTMQPWPV